MALYQLRESQIVPLAQITFADAGVLERANLQRILRDQVDIISPDTLVVAEEFGEWEDSRRRIDLLGVSRDGALVVVELKRTEDGGHMDLQALRYAAMVSTMTFDQTVNAFDAYLHRISRADDARTLLLDFLGWSEPDEDKFGQDVRIVLASAEFSREVTTAVMWLNDHGLDIRCVRLRPYSHGSELFLDVQQVIPLPEASEYQVRIREKVQREKVARETAASREGDAFRAFWLDLFERLRSHLPVIPTGRQPQPSRHFGLPTGRAGLHYTCSFLADGQLRVSLVIERGTIETSKTVFDALARERPEIEAELGQLLHWDRLGGQRRSRIFILHPGVLSDDAAVRDDQLNWLVAAISKFREVFQPRLNKLQLAASVDGIVQVDE